MKNSPYLDRPFVPLAVALRSHAGGDRGENRRGGTRQENAALQKGGGAA
jgi:hypothetical protein